MPYLIPKLPGGRKVFAYHKPRVSRLPSQSPQPIPYVITVAQNISYRTTLSRSTCLHGVSKLAIFPLSPKCPTGPCSLPFGVT